MFFYSLWKDARVHNLLYTHKSSPDIWKHLIHWQLIDKTKYKLLFSEYMLVDWIRREYTKENGNESASTWNKGNIVSKMKTAWITKQQFDDDDVHNDNYTDTTKAYTKRVNEWKTDKQLAYVARMVWRMSSRKALVSKWLSNNNKRFLRYTHIGSFACLCFKTYEIHSEHTI